MTAGVVGVVLAAGRSRRLGQPKQLVAFGARALVWHTTRALLAARPGGGVLVVTPPGQLGERVRAALADLDVQYAECGRPELGISESFRTGIAALPGADAACFVLGDMPLVTFTMHRAVLDAYADTGAPLVLARYGRTAEHDGVRAPPHLFRADLFSEFEQTGDHGPRHLIRAHAAQAVWVDLPALALTDLDTPDDIVRMRGLLD